MVKGWRGEVVNRKKKGVARKLMEFGKGSRYGVTGLINSGN